MDRSTLLIDQANLLLASSGIELSPSQKQRGGVASLVSNFTEKRSNYVADAKPKPEENNHNNLKLSSNPAPLAVAMLHDIAATNELIRLSDLLRQREFEQLQQAQKMLNEEKKIRQDYIRSLQDQMEDLSMKRKKLLIPFLNQQQQSLNNHQDEDAASQRSGGGGGAGGFDGNRSMVGSQQQQQFLLSQQQQQARMRSQTILTAASPSVYSLSQNQQQQDLLPPRSSSPQSNSAFLQKQNLQNQNQQQGFSGAMSNYSGNNNNQNQNQQQQQQAASQSGGPNNHGHLARENPHNQKNNSLATKQRIAESFPGVSFGALTTASAASRYAKHWSREGQQ